MLKDAVLLDAGMTVSEAVRRLAQHGFWRTPIHVEARRWLEEYTTSILRAANLGHLPGGIAANGTDLTPERIAQRLSRPQEGSRVVIRRQHFTTIFWYARDVDEVLAMLSNARPGNTVLDALNLHEYTANQSAQTSEIDPRSIEMFRGILLNGQVPFAVGEPEPRAAPPSRAERSVAFGELATEFDDDAIMGFDGSPEPRRTVEAEREVSVTAFPRLEAPRIVNVGKPFDFTIGLSTTRVAGLPSTGPMRFSALLGATSIAAEAQIIADGFDVEGPWRRPFRIELPDPTKAEIRVRLTARAQDEPVRLTSIVVHYLLDGVTRGSASFHIAVARAVGVAIPPSDPGGISWSESEAGPSAFSLVRAIQVPDIEIDIAKPDGNACTGNYRCVIRTSHGVPLSDEGFPIDLGKDANSFAKELIDQVRMYSSDPIVDNLLKSIGGFVAQKLPAEFWRALRGVAQVVTNRPIRLQLNSAEPYVPWELALVDPPLDSTRPEHLAAQVAMGRWILGDSAIASPPLESLTVKAIAIMAGMYNGANGLSPLPKAVQEAAALAQNYRSLPAVPLQSTLNDFRLLLNASLTLNFEPIGGAEAVHLVGHGEVDPSRPGDAALYLSSGQPLTPLFFLHSKLGAEHKPFIFLNACMVGTGGELLGQFGGFPGACLHGGFTGLIAPLWAVNDDVAKTFALAFYEQALTNGTGRPVAEVLRDLRANYTSGSPVPTYLAYVYYGNPFLTLSSANSPSPKSSPATFTTTPTPTTPTP